MLGLLQLLLLSSTSTQRRYTLSVNQLLPLSSLPASLDHWLHAAATPDDCSSEQGFEHKHKPAGSAVA